MHGVVIQSRDHRVVSGFGVGTKSETRPLQNRVEFSPEALVNPKVKNTVEEAVGRR